MDKYVVVLENDNGKVIGKKLVVTASGPAWDNVLYGRRSTR